jgi:hypothetical protein
MRRIFPLLLIVLLSTNLGAQEETTQQQGMTPEEALRLQLVAASTPTAQIQCRLSPADLGLVRLSCFSGFMAAPKSEAFHTVGFTCPSRNFFGIPISLKVSSGEYRAFGRSGTLTWHIIITDGGLAQQGGYVTYPPQPRLYVSLVEEGEEVLRIGTAREGALCDVGSIAQVTPARIQ